MCAQRDAMRELREAAECLSAVCRARTDPTIRPLVDFYRGTAEEPLPSQLLAALEALPAANSRR